MYRARVELFDVKQLFVVSVCTLQATSPSPSPSAFTRLEQAAFSLVAVCSLAHERALAAGWAESALPSACRWMLPRDASAEPSAAAAPVLNMLLHPRRVGAARGQLCRVVAALALGVSRMEETLPPVRQPSTPHQTIRAAPSAQHHPCTHAEA